MNRSDETRLRQLAKKYSNNILNKEEYRQARREFINDLTKNAISLPENDYLPPVVVRTDPQVHVANDATTQFIGKKDPQLQEGTAFSHSFAAPETAPPEKSNRSTPWFFILSGAVLGLLIIAIAFIPGLLEDGSTQKPTAQTLLEQQGEEQGRQLIRHFLAKKSWHRQDLDGFLIEWQQLTVAQTAIALNSIESKRLANTIYQRLLEEQSLTITDDNAALRRQQLLDFALSIGINDTRLHAMLISN